MSNKTPHTACRRGTRVRVVLRSGEEFVDKFIDRTPGKWVIFETHSRVRQSQISVFTIWKGGDTWKKLSDQAL